MISSSAAVENKPTLAFDERTFSDLSWKKAATMTKTHNTTNTSSKYSSRRQHALAVTCVVSGVNP